MEENLDSQIKATEKAVQLAADVTQQLTTNVLNDTVLALSQDKLRLLRLIRDMKRELTVEKADKIDIYFHLMRKCDDNYELMMKKDGQLIENEAKFEAIIREIENKFRLFREEAEVREGNHLSRIKELEEQLTSLQEYNENKEKHDDILNNLMKTLESERQVNANAIEELREISHAERERLKREYNDKLTAIKKKINDEVNQRISDRTKRTMTQNEELKNEMLDQVSRRRCS